MISCPKCKQTLPDFVTTCQFCGAQIQGVKQIQAVHVDSDGFEHPDTTTGSGLSGEWVRRIYYGLGIFWLLTGLWSILDITVVGPASKGTTFQGGVAYIFLFILVIRLGLAIGYLMRASIAKKVINVFAALGLLGALLSLVGSLMSIMLVGPFGILFVLLSLLDVIVNGGIMWIIGESERPDAFP
ncbi:MAG: hypothetical protein JSS65_08755 [Armatimonadetes bacterium]|nr:hypothetical protein [Armatimonadota bacterium]